MINNFNSETGFSNKPENIINDITAKLASKFAKGKSKKLNSSLSSDDSNLNQNIIKQDLSEFGKLMLHSDEAAISTVKKEIKAKSSLLQTQINKNVSISEKPLSEINILISELSNLFESKPEPKVQFADAQTEDKFLDLIIDNFEDLLTSDTDKISEVYQQAISNKGLNAISSSEKIKNSEVEEIDFSSDYDILNPLNGLDSLDLKSLGIKINNATTNIPTTTNISKIKGIESFIHSEFSSLDTNTSKKSTAENADLGLNINPYKLANNEININADKDIAVKDIAVKDIVVSENTINSTEPKNINSAEVESFIQNELYSLISNINEKSTVVNTDLGLSINPDKLVNNDTNITANNNIFSKENSVNVQTPKILNISEIESIVKSELETLDNVVNIKTTVEISTEPNVNNIKYKLKDLIGIIRQAMKSELEGGNELFNGNLKNVIQKDLKEPNYLKDSESRISSMVEKNTRNLVDNFIPKYFYKGINNLKNNKNSLDFNLHNNTNLLGKTTNDFLNPNLVNNKVDTVYNFGEKLDSANNDEYMTELNKLEIKLTSKDNSTIHSKDLLANKSQGLIGLNTNNLSFGNTNISTKSDEKYNIKLGVEIEPTIEIKANKIIEVVEDVKKINDVKSENNLNNLVNLNQNNTEIKKSENIINRSNSLEFQTFNDIKTDELVETAAKATINTNVGNTSMVRITMNPTALGTVFVEIKMNGENAELNFKANDKDVISTLEKNIAELQESLRKENVEIKSLIIDYKNFSEELNKDGQNKQNNDNNQQNRNNQNKSLFKDLQDVELEQKGISLDKSFYDNLKNFAGSIREELPIYKEVGKMGNNLETIKIKSKVIEKYM